MEAAIRRALDARPKWALADLPRLLASIDGLLLTSDARAQLHDFCQCEERATEMLDAEQVLLLVHSLHSASPKPRDLIASENKPSDVTQLPVDDVIDLEMGMHATPTPRRFSTIAPSQPHSPQLEDNDDDDEDKHERILELEARLKHTHQQHSLTVSSHESHISTLQSSLTAARSELSACQKDLFDLQAKYDRESVDLEQATEECARLRDEQAHWTRERSDLTRKLDQARQMEISLEKQLSDARSTHRTLASQLDNLTHQLDSVTQEKVTLEGRLEWVQAELHRLTQSDIEADWQRPREENARLQSEMEQLMSQVEELKAQVDVLELAAAASNPLAVDASIASQDDVTLSQRPRRQSLAAELDHSLLQQQLTDAHAEIERLKSHPSARDMDTDTDAFISHLETEYASVQQQCRDAWARWDAEHKAKEEYKMKAEREMERLRVEVMLLQSGNTSTKGEPFESTYTANGEGGDEDVKDTHLLNPAQRLESLMQSHTKHPHASPSLTPHSRTQVDMNDPEYAAALARELEDYKRHVDIVTRETRNELERLFMQKKRYKMKVKLVEAELKDVQEERDGLLSRIGELEREVERMAERHVAIEQVHQREVSFIDRNGDGSDEDPFSVLIDNDPDTGSLTGSNPQHTVKQSTQPLRHRPSPTFTPGSVQKFAEMLERRNHEVASYKMRVDQLTRELEKHQSLSVSGIGSPVRVKAVSNVGCQYDEDLGLDVRLGSDSVADVTVSVSTPRASFPMVETPSKSGTGQQAQHTDPSELLRLLSASLSPEQQYPIPSSPFTPQPPSLTNRRSPKSPFSSPSKRFSAPLKLSPKSSPKRRRFQKFILNTESGWGQVIAMYALIGFLGFLAVVLMTDYSARVALMGGVGGMDEYYFSGWNAFDYEKYEVYEENDATTTSGGLGTRDVFGGGWERTAGLAGPFLAQLVESVCMMFDAVWLWVVEYVGMAWIVAGPYYEWAVREMANVGAHVQTVVNFVAESAQSSVHSNF